MRWLNAAAAWYSGAIPNGRWPIQTIPLQVNWEMRLPDLPDDLIYRRYPYFAKVSGREQTFDRIEVLLLTDRALAADPKSIKDLEQRLRRQSLSGELQAAADRLVERASMTAAFRFNLSILSLIALLVGAYLILQASGCRCARREELATLRSLG